MYAVLSDNFDIMIASNDVDVNTAHGSAATTALNSDVSSVSNF